MTNRIVLGVDPGQTGAIAIFTDGKPLVVFDMPVSERRSGGQIIDPKRLFDDLYIYLKAACVECLNGTADDMQKPGAIAYIEKVSAMPGQGVSSMFKFGQSDGMVRGVLGALEMPLVEVTPVVWKKRMGLTGTVKDVARTLALQRFPTMSQYLTRKKDVGRADALLIAAWGVEQRR